MTSQSIRTVIVLGAGGSLGPSILKALAPHFTISILARASSSSTFPPNFKLYTVPDNYASTQLLKAFQGQDAVVSLMSPWACESQQHIIDIAVQAGVKRFIPAEFGYDTTNANAIRLLPALQIRANIVAHLRTKEDEGLSWTAVVTGPFLDWGLGNGYMGFDLVKQEAVIFDEGEQLFSTSTLALVGDAVAKCLLQPAVTQNRYIYVSSFTTTQNEILATLKKLSQGPWRITKVKSEAKIEEANEAFRNGGDLAEASRLLILALSNTEGNGSDFTGRDSNDSLGLLRENMDDVVVRLLSA